MYVMVNTTTGKIISPIDIECGGELAPGRLKQCSLHAT